jgi:signal transduction histidine kinase
LINHAISSSNAEAEVLVSVERRGTDLVVTVENEGAKIPLPTNATLFDPLVRSDVGLQSPSEAAPLGLDLYIGREIVTAHGGTVIADFQGGKNSVTAVLPVVGPVANE